VSNKLMDGDERKCNGCSFRALLLGANGERPLHFSVTFMLNVLIGPAKRSIPSLFNSLWFH